MRESTELGQDKEKIVRLTKQLHAVIEAAYPDTEYTGLQLFEILDALAVLTVFYADTGLKPKLAATAKKYFSQRLMELSKSAKR